jgi:glutathione S-transferase
MKLYNFFRSGTSHRLRIALHLKGLATQYVPVDLRTEAHLQEDFKAVNPQQLVPALVVDGKVLIQSPAIIEWLEEKHPDPALLPRHTDDRAQVRALAATPHHGRVGARARTRRRMQSVLAPPIRECRGPQAAFGSRPAWTSAAAWPANRTL